MENSKPLATESFSYSWLVDSKQHSYSWLVDSKSDQNFNFDVSLTAFDASLVHADEIFSEGHIMPIYIDKTKLEVLKSSISDTPSPLSTFEKPFDERKKRCISVERWRRSSKRILQKCFGLIRPFYRTRKSSRVDDLESCEAILPRPNRFDFKKISNEAAVSSPRISPPRSSSVWSGDESSIHEAILYCKRSIEN